MVRLMPKARQGHPKALLHRLARRARFRQISSSSREASTSLVQARAARTEPLIGCVVLPKLEHIQSAQPCFRWLTADGLTAKQSSLFPWEIDLFCNLKHELEADGSRDLNF